MPGIPELAPKEEARRGALHLPSLSLWGNEMGLQARGTFLWTLWLLAGMEN